MELPRPLRLVLILAALVALPVGAYDRAADLRAAPEHERSISRTPHGVLGSVMEGQPGWHADPDGSWTLTPDRLRIAVEDCLDPCIVLRDLESSEEDVAPPEIVDSWTDTEAFYGWACTTDLLVHEPPEADCR